MNCIFVDAVCTRCGAPINPKVLAQFPDVKRNCMAAMSEPPRIHVTCAHMLGDTGETVAHESSCCTGGEVQTAVWRCRLHGLVAPFAYGPLARASVTPCAGCDDYAAP